MKSYSIQIEETSQKSNSVYNQRDQWKKYPLKTVQKLSKNVLPFDICLLSLHGNINVGTSIRSAHLSGASNVYIFGRRNYNRNSTVGSEHYGNVEKINGLLEDRSIDYDNFFEFLKMKNVIPVFVEQYHKSIYLENVKWKKNTKNYCFIFGNESEGICGKFIEKCLRYFPDCFVLSLTQLNIIRSFNVSAAVSIVSYNFMSNYLQNFKM